VILDSLICGIAAGSLERSKMIHGVVRALGGPEESSVFGLESSVPAVNAAMANAEIMNLLDADDTLFNSIHLAAFNVAAGLAEAQRLGASGRGLVRAVAVGFDVSARINLADLRMQEIDGSFRFTPIMGMGFASFGTAASAAAVAGLDGEQLRNTFGLVGWMAPTPVSVGMPNRSEFESFKYGNYAGTAHAGMLATRLAQAGYVGDQQCLDAAPGFMTAQGGLDTDYELLVDGLGERWWILETSLKYYPSCRYTHGPIDMLQELMREEGLAADDLERIDVYLNPMAYGAQMFREPAKRIAPDHRAPLHGAFNIPYVLALVALGRRPGPSWYSKQNLEDRTVWDVASRIHTAVDPQAEDEARRAFNETRIRRFRKTRGALGVRARGREFHRSTEYCGGDPWSSDTRPSWERIRQKFDEFCGELLPRAAIEEITRQVRGLEDIGDLSRELRLGAGSGDAM
jgi:2-methylcitrate dehydratase PrpD